ncbi:MAG TPA: 1-deoxy-D-xylulose-5-phosphate synthase N-terminal domain-containing protein [Myxococcota bacterium]|nr:1-deoxy-D-xylulose-5-phosphate synthase N-terminal domain-containing protein [Myxococcota bacterium]HOC98587.1 1-deoxy-D-xylulose-5-phosphate synthase N-terminal domain-containing protein [Myxococcota bacterium]HOH75688.1 1-deoxy-D-xylulose-5-phosphate synthase N-terminal domain-containing protein [Myxococcota bacterium]
MAGGWKVDVALLADRVRRAVLEHTLDNDGGYMSQACSSAELLATLYGRFMNIGMPDRPIEPRPWLGTPRHGNTEYRTGADFNGGVHDARDRFILSPTHYSLVLYALLVETGRMSPQGMKQFNRDGSSVEMIGAEHSPGMEVMTGSLGQGLAQAAGMALGRKLKGASGRVVVMMSDGEFQIGMTWESIQFMAHHHLDNMVVFVDVNGQQCDGAVDSVMRIDPIDVRIRSFGARAAVVDGHDPAAIMKAGSRAPDGRPLFVLAMTDPCRGLDLMRKNAPKLHYLRFRTPQEKAGYKAVLDAWPKRGS